MITFTIDTLTPCLTETSTGEIFETEVIQLKRKSFLSKFNKRTGWYVNWSKFEDDVEVYALVLKGTVDVQGLIAIKYDDVLQHYVEHFQAFQLSVTERPYQFMIEGENTQKLMEVYNYEWTEEEL